MADGSEGSGANCVLAGGNAATKACVISDAAEPKVSVSSAAAPAEGAGTDPDDAPDGIPDEPDETAPDEPGDMPENPDADPVEDPDEPEADVDPEALPEDAPPSAPVRALEPPLPHAQAIARATGATLATGPVQPERRSRKRA
ncbi:MAG: hypothetical protein M3O50_01185 [Myxococcota bacterium]|nr:hypothetical protein [Myxococcota bacterium]